MVNYTMFTFRVIRRDKNSRARVGIFETPHGPLETPELAIVGTNAAFRGLNPDKIPPPRIAYAIANTFHLLVNNNVDKIAAAGGIHAFMRYQRVMATDSGGFQVFSLGFGKTHNVNKLGIGAIFPGQNKTESDTDNPLKITEEGVSFPYDGRRIILTPELSIQLQHRIGADIIFAFDECTSSLNSREYTEQALERTHRWLTRCLAAHEAFQQKQALFPIVQGGAYRDLRERSAKLLAQKDVSGYGIGGSLGKTKEDMHAILEWTIPLLPDTRPRHLLGIGAIRDIFEGVERGVDLFDCVIPTREARHRVLYTTSGRQQIRIGKAVDTVIDKRPGSPTAESGITWRQLALWFQAHDPRAHEYAVLHNIFFFTELMREIREAIASGRFSELKRRYLSFY